jgi:hypothetical protein
MISFLSQASQPDELTIEEQEVLEVIDDGDMEDWVKVQSAFQKWQYFTVCALNLNKASGTLKSSYAYTPGVMFNRDLIF